MVLPVPINFINLPFEEIERGLVDALGHIALMAGAVKASVFLFSEDLQTVTGSYEWFYGENHPSVSPNSSTDFFSGYLERWKNFETFFISSPSGRNKWPGTDSIVFVPLVFRGKLYGAMGLYKKAHTEWPDDAVELLEFMAPLVINVIERKKTEEHLRKAREKYKNLYHYAHVGLFETSLEEAKIIACNRLYCQMAGFTSVEEAINQDVLQFYTNPAHREEIKKILMEKGFIENYVTQFRNRMTDKKFWAEFSAMVNRDRNVIEGTIIDITARKEAEDTLVFTQFAMDNARDAVYLVDSESKFVYVNHAACKYLGYSREELLTMGISDIRPEYTEQWWKSHMQEIKEKKSFMYESINRRKDGTVFPVEVSVNYLEFCGREYNCAFLRNISERKTREGERNRLVYILEATSDLVSTATPDGKIIYMNRAGRELLNWTEDKNSDFVKYAHPDWALDMVMNTGVHSARKNGVWHGETAVLNGEGREIPVSQVIIAHKASDGRVEYFSTILRDISRIKKGEESLAAEKERLSVTLKSIGDGVIATDISGRITIMNGVAEKLTGWTLEEGEGKKLSDVFHIVNEMTGEVCDNPVQKVLLSGDIVELANHTMLISRDGRKMLIADSGAPIKDKNNQVTGVVLVFRDITERQRIMENLQKIQKLDSLGLLAGGIAHDFNNLLGGIFGYIELAREACKDNEASLFLSCAFKLYDRAKSLTRQLLTFAKGGSPLKKTDDLTSIIMDTVNFALAGSSLKCVFNIDEHLWLCDFDSSQIRQAIHNIVINAVQAMPDGGDICVSAENIQSLPAIHMSHGKGKYVKISVMDKGTGVPRELLGNIFDPFFTTKQKCTGIGLSIVYSIISKHDGFIDLESEEGKGTVVNIYLPVSKDGIKEVISARTVAGHVTCTGKGTVLVMDDDEDLRKILERILKKIGYSTVLTANSREAFSAFIEAEKSAPFSTAFLDMTIPGDMGGKEVIKNFLIVRPELKAVAISGYSDDPVMAEPKKFGFAAALKKPFLKDEILTVLNDLDI
ncbi:MAG: PAS domain S-box protein [Candidatus Eremiobacterota bacterium]